MSDRKLKLLTVTRAMNLLAAMLQTCSSVL